MNNNILSQINDLKTLTMAQLRQRWIVLFTTDPPAYGRAYLERRLAYRLQEFAASTDPFDAERWLASRPEYLAPNALFIPGHASRVALVYKSTNI